MDEQTSRYYSMNARQVAERYDTVEPPIAVLLRRTFAPGERVLDIGAGSGRDLELLLSLGCNAFGVEPCDELRSVALEKRPLLEGRLEAASLPDLGKPFGGSFDGVVCSAVLQHLRRADVLDAAIAIRNVLTENGHLILSVPRERPTLTAEHRDQLGRLFTPLPADYLQLLFERVGFHLVEVIASPDTLDRPGYSWSSLVFQVRNTDGNRPLDQIESILNRDKKTATYKLALFRALSEIATTDFEQARWLGDGAVGVPVASVCDKWLGYYWPLFESPAFIPQIRGEAPVCAKPVAFRSALDNLIDVYKHRGGLTGFVLDYRNAKLPEQVRPVVGAVFHQLRKTIVNGPVTYAGGSLEVGRVFSYDERTSEIRMRATLWRELSLVGHWIQEAVILRWAELTSEISKGNIRPSHVIDLLLTVPIPERDVGDARRAYSRMPVPVCTWSGERIKKDFAVDHIIPFSLWHNNDLWNLVPATPMVNSAKSDKLPTRRLMLARRDLILGSWGYLRSNYPDRFDYEVCHFAGLDRLPSDWPDLAFRCVTNAVEITAAQRGSRRWEPSGFHV